MTPSLATLNRMVRVFTRSAPALPGKTGLASAAGYLVTLIATLRDDSGAPPAATPASTDTEAAPSLEAPAAGATLPTIAVSKLPDGKIRVNSSY